MKARNALPGTQVVSKRLDRPGVILPPGTAVVGTGPERKARVRFDRYPGFVDEWIKPSSLRRITPPAPRGLTFAELRAANMARCGRWHPGFPADDTWTGADWSNAVGGEAGELAEAALAIVAFAGKVQNTVKKLRRYELSTNTAVDKPVDELWADFDREMADVACYLDLLATKYGRDLEGAIVAKFNAVSERQGFPERIGGGS